MNVDDIKTLVVDENLVLCRVLLAFHLAVHLLPYIVCITLLPNCFSAAS
jgi:hypothetical protein